MSKQNVQARELEDQGSLAAVSARLAEGMSQEEVADVTLTDAEHSAGDDEPPSPGGEDERPDEDGLKLLGKATLAVAFLAWISLFVGGLTVDTLPFRCQISEDAAVLWEGADPDRDCVDNAADGQIAFAWFAILVLFTPVNIMLLSSTAGVLGAVGRRALLHAPSRMPPGEQDTEHPVGPESDRDPSNPYLSGVLRGFLVYLFLMSGVLLVMDSPLGAKTPQQYIRLAGLVSLVSFLSSYNPRVLGSLMHRAIDALDGRAGLNGDERRSNRGQA